MFFFYTNVKPSDSVTIDLPSETNLMDVLVTALAPMLNSEASELLSHVSTSNNNSPSEGQQVTTNTRFGLDLLLLPFFKNKGLPFTKLFDLLSLVKLVKIPAAGFGRDASSLLFYSLLPSMLPTLMATGLFLYGGTAPMHLINLFFLY